MELMIYVYFFKKKNTLHRVIFLNLIITTTEDQVRKVEWMME